MDSLPQKNNLSEIVEKSRILMKDRTIENGAPAWDLTEISVKKGRELANQYKLDPDIISIALYLAHIVFSKEIGGDIQKNHEILSADEAEKFLHAWKVDQKTIKIIINSIKAHHNRFPIQYKEAEIVKNAEGYKFITMKGACIFLHDLGSRGMTFEEALTELHRKYRQKKELLTLSECIKDADDFGRVLEEYFL